MTSERAAYLDSLPIAEGASRPDGSDSTNIAALPPRYPRAPSQVEHAMSATAPSNDLCDKWDGTVSLDGYDYEPGVGLSLRPASPKSKTPPKTLIGVDGIALESMVVAPNDRDACIATELQATFRRDGRAVSLTLSQADCDAPAYGPLSQVANKLPFDQKEGAHAFEALRQLALKQDSVLIQQATPRLGWHNHDGTLLWVAPNGCLNARGPMGARPLVAPNVAEDAPQQLCPELPAFQPEHVIGALRALFDYLGSTPRERAPMLGTFGLAIRVALRPVESDGHPGRASTQVEWAGESNENSTGAGKSAGINAILRATAGAGYEYDTPTETTGEGELKDSAIGASISRSALSYHANQDYDHACHPGTPGYEPEQKHRVGELRATGNLAKAGTVGRPRGGTRKRPPASGLTIRTLEGNPHDFTVEHHLEGADERGMTFHLAAPSEEVFSARVARSRQLFDVHAPAGLDAFREHLRVWQARFNGEQWERARAHFTSAAARDVAERQLAGHDVHPRTWDKLREALEGIHATVIFLKQLGCETDWLAELRSELIEDRIAAGIELRERHKAGQGGRTETERVRASVGDLIRAMLRDSLFIGNGADEPDPMPGMSPSEQGLSTREYQDNVTYSPMGARSCARRMDGDAALGIRPSTLLDGIRRHRIPYLESTNTRRLGEQLLRADVLNGTSKGQVARSSGSRRVLAIKTSLIWPQDDDDDPKGSLQTSRTSRTSREDAESPINAGDSAGSLATGLNPEPVVATGLNPEPVASETPNLQGKERLATGTTGTTGLKRPVRENRATKDALFDTCPLGDLWEPGGDSPSAATPQTRAEVLAEAGITAEEFEAWAREEPGSERTPEGPPAPEPAAVDGSPTPATADPAVAPRAAEEPVEAKRVEAEPAKHRRRRRGTQTVELAIDARGAFAEGIGRVSVAPPRDDAEAVRLALEYGDDVSVSILGAVHGAAGLPEPGSEDARRYEPGPDRHPEPHPWATGKGPGGQPIGRGGLEAAMSWRSEDGSRRVIIRALGIDTRIPGLAGASDAETVVGALVAFRESLTTYKGKHRGFSLGPSPGSTGRQLMKAARATGRLQLGESIMPPPVIEAAADYRPLIPPLDWSRAIGSRDRQYRNAVEADRNAAWLAASRSLPLGSGEPVRLDGREAAERFDRSVPGWWQLARPLARPAENLPDPFESCRETCCYPTPLLDLAQWLELDFHVTGAWVYEHSGRYLETWAKRLGDAYTTLGARDDPAAKIALGLVKATYRQALGWLEGGFYEGGEDFHRPDWYATIRAESNARLFRHLWSLPERPLEVHTDSIVVPCDESTAEDACARLGLRFGNKPGEYKPSGLIPMAAAIQVRDQRLPIARAFRDARGTDGQL